MLRKLYICNHTLFCNLQVDCIHSKGHVPQWNCWSHKGECSIFCKNSQLSTKDRICIETESYIKDKYVAN